MFWLMGCLMSSEEYSELQIRAGDADGDGYADAAFAFGDDCDDSDPLVNPGAVELAYNGLDDDCDSRTPDDDLDLDGVGSAEDCDDADPGRSPELAEVWYDGVDQNCDGNDTDQDGDGEAWVDVGGQDCDDTDPKVQMRSWYVDGDRDGYGDIDDPVLQCEPVDGRQELGEDCDDRDPEISPDALEICNDGVDNDCSGDAPECQVQSGELADAAIYVWYGDEPGDGFGSDHGVADLDGDGELEVLSSAPGSGCVHYSTGTSGTDSWCPGDVGGLISRVGDLDSDGSEDFAYETVDGRVQFVSGAAALSNEPAGLPSTGLADRGMGAWLDLARLSGTADAGTLLTLQSGQDKDFLVSYRVDGEAVVPEWTGFIDEGALGESKMAMGDFEGDGSDQVVIAVQKTDDVRQIFVYSPAGASISTPETADAEIGTRLLGVDGIQVLDVNSDGYADLVATVAEPGDSSLYVALGPELPRDLGQADAEMVGTGILTVGANFCLSVIESTGDPIAVFGTPDGHGGDSTGAVFGVEIPLSGNSELSDSIWSLSSGKDDSGQVIGCHPSGLLTPASVLVSEGTESADGPGSIVLFALDGM